MKCPNCNETKHEAGDNNFMPHSSPSTTNEVDMNTNKKCQMIENRRGAVYSINNQARNGTLYGRYNDLIMVQKTMRKRFMTKLAIVTIVILILVILLLFIII